MIRLRSLLLLLLFFLPSVASAQTGVGVIEITDVDYSNYPTIAISFAAQNQEGAGIDTFDTLQLVENESPIETFDLVTLPSGVDVTFVIDANRTIEGIDLIGDSSRLEKVRQTIANFALQYVSRTNSDRISVLAPNEGVAQFLLRDVTDPDLIADGIRAYAPPQLPAEAPVQTMLELAFEQAAQREPTDKYQAIILFSDTEFLADQVDFFALRELALQSDVVFFGAILGKVASQSEIDSINELAIPTGGTHIHMPQQENFDPLIDIIKSNSSRSQVRYRSTMVQSGTAAVRLGLEALSAETSYEITINPATVQIIQGQPIIREGDYDAPVAQYEPTVHPITAQISWSDGYPRAIDNVRLFVNGLEQRLPQPPILDTRGVLTFVWEIASLGTGTYQLEVEVTDELGVTTRSAAQLQRIEAQPINPPETPTAAALAPVVTPDAPLNTRFEETLDSLTPERLTTGMIFLISVLFVTLMFKWARRKQEEEESAEAAPLPNTPQLPENVYLELIDEEHSTSHLIPIKTDSVSIGSDPFSADVIVNDNSVSRLHARIIYEDEQYFVYDEGSVHGTRINYERVGLRPRAVTDGDELVFGNTQMRFRIFGSAGSYKPLQPMRQKKIHGQEPPPHLTDEETLMRDRPISEEADQSLPAYLREESPNTKKRKLPKRDLRREVEQPTAEETDHSS